MCKGLRHRDQQGGGAPGAACTGPTDGNGLRGGTQRKRKSSSQLSDLYSRRHGVSRDLCWGVAIEVGGFQAGGNSGRRLIRRTHPLILAMLGGLRTGRWSEEEKQGFVVGLEKYGRDWRKISSVVTTRSLTQIRTHAQKFFKSQEKERSITTPSETNEKGVSDPVLSTPCEEESGSASEQSSNGNSGRWTDEEKKGFVVGLHKFGRDWRKISSVVTTRSLTQIRTHAQKFFKRNGLAPGTCTTSTDSAMAAKILAQSSASDGMQFSDRDEDRVQAVRHLDVEGGGMAFDSKHQIMQVPRTNSKGRSVHALVGVAEAMLGMLGGGGVDTSPLTSPMMLFPSSTSPRNLAQQAPAAALNVQERKRLQTPKKRRHEEGSMFSISPTKKMKEGEGPFSGHGNDGEGMDHAANLSAGASASSSSSLSASASRGTAEVLKLAQSAVQAHYFGLFLRESSPRMLRIFLFVIDWTRLVRSERTNASSSAAAETVSLVKDGVSSMAKLDDIGDGSRGEQEQSGKQVVAQENGELEKEQEEQEKNEKQEEAGQEEQQQQQEGKEQQEEQQEAEHEVEHEQGEEQREDRGKGKGGGEGYGDEARTRTATGAGMGWAMGDSKEKMEMETLPMLPPSPACPTIDALLQRYFTEGSTSCLSGFLPGLTKAVVQQALEKNRNAIQQVFSTSLALLRQWVEPYDRSAEAAAARAQLATHSIEC